MSPKKRTRKPDEVVVGKNDPMVQVGEPQKSDTSPGGDEYRYDTVFGGVVG
jgi:hypothetical protein